MDRIPLCFHMFSDNDSHQDSPAYHAKHCEFASSKSN